MNGRGEIPWKQDNIIEEIIKMPDTVIDKAAPGTALSANEATTIKKAVASYIEGIGMKKGTYGPLEFKDDRQKKRNVYFNVTNIDGKTIHIEITNVT